MYLCAFDCPTITEESFFNSASVNNIHETGSRIKPIEEEGKCLKFWFKKKDEIHALASSIENAENNSLLNSDCLINDNYKNNNLNRENTVSHNLMKVSDHSYACRLNSISDNENIRETLEDYKVYNRPIIKKSNDNTLIRSQKNPDNAVDREKQWLKISTEHLYTKQLSTGDDWSSDSKNNVGETLLPSTKTNGGQNLYNTNCSTQNLELENKTGGKYVLSKLISSGRTKTLGSKYILVSNSNFQKLVASNLVQPMPLLALSDCQIVTKKDGTIVCSDFSVDNCTNTHLSVQSVEKTFIGNDKKLVIDNLIENSENICCFNLLNKIVNGDSNSNDDLLQLKNSEGQVDFSCLNVSSENSINNVHSTKQFIVSNVMLDHSYSHRTEYLVSHAEHTLRSNNNIGSNDCLKSLRKSVRSRICICCNNKKDMRSNHKSAKFTRLKKCKKQKFIDKICTDRTRIERNFSNSDYNSGRSINLTLNIDDKISLPFPYTANNMFSTNSDSLKSNNVQVSSNSRATANNYSIVDVEKLKYVNLSDLKQNDFQSFMNMGNQTKSNRVSDNTVEMSSVSKISSFVHKSNLKPKKTIENPVLRKILESNRTTGVQILDREDKHYNRIQLEHSYTENGKNQAHVTKISDLKKCNVCCIEENLNDKTKRLCPVNCYVRLNRIDHRILCKRKYTIAGRSMVANESSTGFGRYEHKSNSLLVGNSCKSGQSAVMDCGEVLPKKQSKQCKEVELLHHDNFKELKLNNMNNKNGETCNENLNYCHKNDSKLKRIDYNQTKSSMMKCGTIRLNLKNNQRIPSKLGKSCLKDFNILERLNGLVDNNKCCSMKIKSADTHENCAVDSNLLAGGNNDSVIRNKLKISKSSSDKCTNNNVSRITCSSTQPTKNDNLLELNMNSKHPNETVSAVLPSINNNTSCSNLLKTCCSSVRRDICVSYSKDCINILPNNYQYSHKSEISNKKIVKDSKLCKKKFRKMPIILLEDINEQVTFLENFSLRPVWAVSKNRTVDKTNIKIKNRLRTLNKNCKVK